MAIEISTENKTIIFTINAPKTTNKPFHWHLEGEGVSANCFVGDVLSGTGTITETATVPITVKEDYSVENLRNFRMVVKDTNDTGEVMAISSQVNVVVDYYDPPTEEPLITKIGFFVREDNLVDPPAEQVVSDFGEEHIWSPDIFENKEVTYYNSDGTVWNQGPTPNSEIGLPWKHFNSYFNFYVHNDYNDVSSTFERMQEYDNYFGEVTQTLTNYFKVFHSKNKDKLFFKVKIEVLGKSNARWPLNDDLSIAIPDKCFDFHDHIEIFDEPEVYYNYLETEEFSISAEQLSNCVGFIKFEPARLLEYDVGSSESRRSGSGISWIDIRGPGQGEYETSAGRAYYLRLTIIETDEENNVELGVLGTIEFTAVNRAVQTYNTDESISFRHIASVLNFTPGEFVYQVEHEVCGPRAHTTTTTQPPLPIEWSIEPDVTTVSADDYITFTIRGEQLTGRNVYTITEIVGTNISDDTFIEDPDGRGPVHQTFNKYNDTYWHTTRLASSEYLVNGAKFKLVLSDYNTGDILAESEEITIFVPTTTTTTTTEAPQDYATTLSFLGLRNIKKNGSAKTLTEIFADCGTIDLDEFAAGFYYLRRNGPKNFNGDFTFYGKIEGSRGSFKKPIDMSKLTISYYESVIGNEASKYPSNNAAALPAWRENRISTSDISATLDTDGFLTVTVKAFNYQNVTIATRTYKYVVLKYDGIEVLVLNFTFNQVVYQSLIPWWETPGVIAEVNRICDSFTMSSLEDYYLWGVMEFMYR